MSRVVAVVAHTHWDREWYAPFETYRGRLVEMMDGLLDLLDADSEFTHFHLDGQIALVDDYLEARPHRRPQLEALMRAGRLAAGPWYVLMDEFLASAETVVRNLQLGLRRAAEMGRAGEPVGYLPDMFGHVSQMPQILARAGISDAVVWRGVPAAVDRSGFWWTAPDGSRIRAEYLPVGYANGAFLPEEPGALVRRVGAHELEIGGFLRPGWPMLLMNGGDHHGPQPALPALLDAANRAQDHLRFRQSDLAGFLSGAPRDGLAEWSGELRSGARAPILMGVLSSRVDIKQAAAAVEVALERTAEPLATLWLPPGSWPGDDLDRAWLETIRNSAHDSICGCSVDEVGRAVLQRYDTARGIATDVTASAAAIASVATAAAGPVVLNPSSRSRSGLVELLLPGTEPPPGTQQIQATESGTVVRAGAGRDLGRILAALADDGWLGPTGLGRAATVTEDRDGGISLTLEHDPTGRAEPAMASIVAEAWARAGAAQRLLVTVHRAAWQQVLARADDVPGWGWAVWAPAPLSVQPVDVAGNWVDNGLVCLEIDPSSGTFAIDGFAGQNGLVDEPDEGDTYNFSPVEGARPVGDPEHVEIETLEEGPLRAVVRVRRRYAWPDAVEVLSDLEVQAGDPAVRITTSFHNRNPDHRLRATFRLPRPAGRTVAECAFDQDERAPGAEGGPDEHPLPTFPARRFVTAGELTVAHQGLHEYELTGGGTVLALTLMRATGVLSRPAPPYRPVIAGPPQAVPDAQMPGPRTFRYAVARGCDNTWALADRLWTPMVTVPGFGVGHLPEKGSRLRLHGAEVSALHRVGGAVEVRVFNPSERSTVVEVPGHTGWLVDLQGRRERRWAGQFDLAPGVIATARLDRRSLDD